MHLKFNLPKKILCWYDNNKRILPWRVSKNSTKKLYYRLLSEFMLQQTQVKTVIPYFNKFTKKFKTLHQLSKCNEQKVLKLWEGLGYYRRARNLLLTSKILVNKYNSKLPKTIKEIKDLPGIGDYTANALIGLVHNLPTIAVDGNVKRIFSRIINKKEEKINFDQFIDKNKKKLFNSDRNSDFVEALMEFGALVCKPIDPKCNICNLKKNCKYFNSSKKIKNNKRKMIEHKNYDVFCYINKKKQIGLTKKNNLGFLNQFNLPRISVSKRNAKNSRWKFLKKYKNSISNKKLNINLYYKFSNKIPESFTWYSMDKDKEFIPTFTKKIFRQVSILF
tara:strand:- start:3524 stop:4525 length:1002 start_codon:yes stop_codon:yes gene_type:complete